MNRTNLIGRIVINLVMQAIVLGIFGLLFGWLSTPLYAMAFVASVLFSAWQHSAAVKRYHEGVFLAELGSNLSKPGGFFEKLEKRNEK